MTAPQQPGPIPPEQDLSRSHPAEVPQQKSERAPAQNQSIPFNGAGVPVEASRCGATNGSVGTAQRHTLATRPVSGWVPRSNHGCHRRGSNVTDNSARLEFPNPSRIIQRLDFAQRDPRHIAIALEKRTDDLLQPLVDSCRAKSLKAERKPLLARVHFDGS